MSQVNGCAVLDFVSVLPVPPQTERRRGILRFVGHTDFAPGVWAGVELVGSGGRNDGSVMGTSYFSCSPGQGVFVRPELIAPYTHDSNNNNEARLREELQRRELELRLAREELRTVTLMHDAKEVELRRAREQMSTMMTAAQTAKKEEEVTAATQTEEGEEKEGEGKEAEGEIESLVQQCADLRDLCDLQEDEINRQREHADSLEQIIEEMQEKHEQERMQMQETIHSLEEEVTKHEQIVSELRMAGGKALPEEDTETNQLHAFQQQQEREALRLLKERYEKLYAEREQERHDQELKWKQKSAEYEEAIAQQREYKNRLQDDLRQMQQQVTHLRNSREHDRIVHVPLSALEREEYDSKICKLEWELMTVHGEMFSKRYDQFLAPVSNWNSPAEIIGKMSQAVMSTARIVPFTTPESCADSRMVLFQMRPQR